MQLYGTYRATKETFRESESVQFTPGVIFYFCQSNSPDPGPAPLRPVARPVRPSLIYRPTTIHYPRADTRRVARRAARPRICKFIRSERSQIFPRELFINDGILSLLTAEYRKSDNYLPPLPVFVSAFMECRAER